jgi:BlaR1 peptidase M56/HEAT repeats
VAVGIWSPKVLLPPDFNFLFSAQDQENVLRHEIAHLDRFDDWWNLVQQLCIALFPINPFLWLLRWRLRLLEEIACDDWALAGSPQPRNYANLLTRLAANKTVEVALASGASRRGNQLYQRVARILDKTCDRSLKVSIQKMILVGCATIGFALGGLFLLPVVPASGEIPNLPEIREVRPALSSEVINLLKNSALNDSDAGVRAEAVTALNRSDSQEVTAALLSLLNESKDERVRLLILHGLTRERVGEASVKEKLNDLATNEQSPPVRIAALSALARNIDDRVVDKFISIYQSATAAPVKQICLLGLADASSKSAKDFLMSVAKNDSEPAMRRVAVRALSGDGVRRILVRSNAMSGNEIFLRRRDLVPTEKGPNGLDYFPFVPHDEMRVEPGPELTLQALPEELQEYGMNRIELPKIIARKLLPGSLPPESPATQPSAKPSETHEE